MGQSVSVVEVTFSVRDDLQVDAHLGPDWPVFNDALADSISSLPPRGAIDKGPSIYWIIKAEQGAVAAQRSGDQQPFIWGNDTRLRVVGDSVVANHDYDDDDQPGESMPVSDFLEILAGWRMRVLESSAGATDTLPDTYRRNGIEPIADAFVDHSVRAGYLVRLDLDRFEPWGTSATADLSVEEAEALADSLLRSAERVRELRAEDDARRAERGLPPRRLRANRYRSPTPD